MGIQAVLVLAAIFHIAAVGSGIFLTNLYDPAGVAYYGGESGIFPSDDSAYGDLTSFLMGDDALQTETPAREGGFGIFRYIITSGMCAGSDVTKMALSVMTFNYPVIQLFPSEGFGLWIKLIIHAVSTCGSYLILSRLVQFLIKAGVLGNPYILAGLGVMSAVGIISTFANGAGALAC